MKITQIVDAVSTAIYKATNIGVFAEDIDSLNRPALQLKAIYIQKTLMGQNRQRLVIDWDLLYFPSKQGSCNLEIYDKLDELDEAFGYNGYKFLKVLDRAVQMENVSHHIANNIGHYMFRTDFIVQYGTMAKYDLMEDIELVIKIDDNE